MTANGNLFFGVSIRACLPCRKYADGTLEALFFVLGVQADSVMGIVLREDADKQEVSMLIDNTRDAFADGVVSELV